MAGKGKIQPAPQAAAEWVPSKSQMDIAFGILIGLISLGCVAFVLALLRFARVI